MGFPKTNQVIKIRPGALAGINGYADEIQACYFCWRWFVDSQGVKRRVLTVEFKSDTSTATMCPKVTKKLRPRDLVGINGYAKELAKSFFCWRWYTKDNNKYRVLTVEDSNQDDSTYTNNTPTIKPQDFDGINGYSNEINGLNFCWRWFNRDSVSFKAITIE
mmetsp:Transcript_2697/g.3031  ORF Transcript_2697/g.3031 Transcript_2697/m.3031 type:complete len:162 (+) Transcript_2697:143-628(+)